MRIVDIHDASCEYPQCVVDIHHSLFGYPQVELWIFVIHFADIRNIDQTLTSRPIHIFIKAYIAQYFLVQIMCSAFFGSSVG